MSSASRRIEELRAPARERDLLAPGAPLSAVERFQIGFVRKTFERGVADRLVRTLQRTVGANWIDVTTRNLRTVHGEGRLPPFDPQKSYIVVSNHRSFFDLYVVTAYLVKRGLRHRLLFPVRSTFFYDHPLGFVVNGAMSFYAMYPPVFRERTKAALNISSLDEVARLLRGGGVFVGLHPEGTRNRGEDPYALLPAQGGVGRIIQAAGVQVLPVFVNGLSNDFVRQVGSNFTRTGEAVNVVFGEPVDFGGMLDEAPSPRLHKRISEHALAAIARLGDEEREIRRQSAR